MAIINHSMARLNEERLWFCFSNCSFKTSNPFNLGCECNITNGPGLSVLNLSHGALKSMKTAIFHFLLSMSSSSTSRNSVVLNLDETFIVTTFLHPSTGNFPIRVRRRQLFVKPRTGLKTFIRTASQDYDLFSFPVSARKYGNTIIDVISPETPPECRFFRDDCLLYCGYQVKDLRILGGPLSQILLIDDLEGSALMQPANLVRVSLWQWDLRTAIV
jgi:TFIIF-interacting CTD phosphatase-like protein